MVVRSSLIGGAVLLAVLLATKVFMTLGSERTAPLVERLAWPAFKERFISPEGRVLDTANANISHSEGQGYAMVLAVAADDRETFERLYAWTDSTLQIRGDGFHAWKYVPEGEVQIPDINAATDGEILIAWALARAGRTWNNPEWTEAARDLARAIRRDLIVTLGRHTVLLSAPEGFDPPTSAGSQRARVTINPSYWVFPAFKELAALDPSPVWEDLEQTGLEIIQSHRFGMTGLVPDWVVLNADSSLSLADDTESLPYAYGYNAIRVPLYLIWAGYRDTRTLAPYVLIYSPDRDADRPPLVVNLIQGQVTRRMDQSGYRAIPDLVGCNTGDSVLSRWPGPSGDPDADYYPAVLRRLAILAAHEQGIACTTPRLAPVVESASGNY